MPFFNFKFNNCGFKKKDLEQAAKKSLFLGDSENFILALDDKISLEKIKELAKRQDGEIIGAILVIGIGGSSLGAQAIYSALRPAKIIIFADTIDPFEINKTIKEINVLYQTGKKAVFVLISESGETTETIANYGVLINEFKRIDSGWRTRTIVITTQDSKLDFYAKKQGFEKLIIPKAISGRYSVFTAVGLFPLALAGVKIEKLLDGAKSAIESRALSGATAIYLNYRKNKNIHNIFLFSERLKRFGAWYRQLIAESLGKDGKGITPIVSMGPVDLHSMAQLYFDGPRDKLTTFISIKNQGVDFKVSEADNLEELVFGISGKSLGKIMESILDGVKRAYKKMKMPFLEIELENISEESLGALMMTKMMEAVYLAKLLKVNAFNQPAVEFYKKEARDLLSGSPKK